MEEVILDIVLEGLPGAGKSSNIRRLINELPALAIPGESRLFLRTLGNYKLIDKYYWLNEEIKTRLAKSFQAPIVLFDRCYVSALAYAYALTSVRGHHRGFEECYEEQLSWYRRSMVEGRLVRPDLIIVLDVNPHISVSRKPNAHDFDDVWADIECLKAMRNYYKLFFEILEPNQKVAWVDTHRNSQDVYKDILAHISTEMSP
jgi:thymidylate kinase